VAGASIVEQQEGQWGGTRIGTIISWGVWLRIPAQVQVALISLTLIPLFITPSPHSFSSHHNFAPISLFIPPHFTLISLSSHFLPIVLSVSSHSHLTLIPFRVITLFMGVVWVMTHDSDAHPCPLPIPPSRVLPEIVPLLFWWSFFGGYM
jgi:hypothetical protein